MDIVYLCYLRRGLSVCFLVWGLVACVEHSQRTGNRQGVSDCLELENCPDLDGVVPVGADDFSREGQPGSEKYRESSETLAALFACQEIEIVGAGADPVMIRSSLEADYVTLSHVSEGSHLQVLQFESQGPEEKHDLESSRISRLWYKIAAGEKMTDSGWITAVYTRCRG